uniref:Protein kinase domain-containing protein n=1 Tax=Tetradesmus obliquus TaxID=3088 RepID=A0A383VEV7_TETOB|eukprot:jgi/Sobl393_1/5677/SZX62916.1
MLILTLWLALMLRGSCEAVRQDAWHSSSTNFSFKQELTDAAISIIVVPGNYSVAAEFENHQAPIQLTRNVTLTGAQGLDTVLDLAFLHGVVQLCATCVFTIRNITLTNDRRGGYGLIDFLIGQPTGSSILRLHDVQRLRIACSSGPSIRDVVLQTPRSKHVPGADKPQRTGVGNVTWNGRTWLNVLMNEDYTVDVRFAMEEGGHHEGGYAVDGKRTRSLCEHTVSAACLANKEPQVCIEEIIDETLAARRAAANNGRPHPAAIVVPAIGAVLLVWASVAFVLWWRHWHRRPQKSLPGAAAAEAADLNSIPSVLSSTKTSSAAQQPSDVEKGVLQQPQQHSKSFSTRKEGWVLAHSLTSPALGPVKDSTVQFGELLGAGSFGRVYRGRWNGMEVAVKVIEHDASSAVEVENEVLLIMGLQHECIVAAYHYARFAASAASDAATASPASAAAAQPSSNGSNSVSTTRQLSNGSKRGSGEKTNGRDAASKQRKAESHLVMELCDCGTLTHTLDTLLTKRRQRRQQQQADPDMPVQVLLLLRDVARGLQAIHSRNIVHGDLNARNVLVRSNAAAAAGLTAKLADFGLSRAMKQHQTHRTTKTCGTMSHMPPEVLKEGRMSPAMDVYAFGVMMWEAATGKTAFKELHYGSFYQAIVLQGLRPAMPAGMLQDSAALMRQCWAAKPGDRPTADQLLDAIDALIAARGGCTG